MSRRLLRTPDAAERLKLKPATLINYRYRGMGPCYSKLGNIVVYDESELDAWVDAQRVEPGLKKPSTLEAA